MPRIITTKRLKEIADRVCESGSIETGHVTARELDEILALARIALEAERNAREILQCVEGLGI